MKNIILWISTLLMLVGCVTTDTATGISYADNRLKKDVLGTIKTFEAACSLQGQEGIKSYSKPEVIHYKPTKLPRTTTDSWEEIWTIQRIGYTTSYKIKFTPTPDIGGCALSVSWLGIE